MGEKGNLNEGNISISNMKMSLYGRYLSFDKQLSDILFYNNIKAVDFKEMEESIIFYSGAMFDVRRKGNNAVIYSKELADFFRAKLNLPDYEGAQRVYITYNGENYIIPIKSNNFLQSSFISYKYQQIPTKK